MSLDLEALIIQYVPLQSMHCESLSNKLFKPIQRVMNALIQSAALYTYGSSMQVLRSANKYNSLCLILSLALYARQNNVQYIFAAIVCAGSSIFVIFILTESLRIVPWWSVLPLCLKVFLAEAQSGYRFHNDCSSVRQRTSWHRKRNRDA